MSMRSWIRKLFSRPVTRRICKAPRRARLTLETLEDRCVPAIFTVLNTLDDTNSGSLRWAVGQANGTTGDDTIVFDSTAFSTAKTISLTGTPLTLTDTTGATTITGPAAGVTVSAAALSRVWQIDADVTASMSAVTIRGGSTSDGIFTRGTLSLTDCTITGNGHTGVYIRNPYSSTTTTLTRCTVKDNQLGLQNYSSTLTLTDCTVSGNSGGGMINKRTVKLTNCTVSGNALSGKRFGGLYNVGNATLTNCTVSGNVATKGGAIYNGYQGRKANATLTDCTISGNSATEKGAGIFNLASDLTLTNCTVRDHTTGEGIYNGGGTATLTNCTLSGNGTGVINDGTLTLDNSTLSGNSSGLVNSGTATLTDCTVNGNSGGGIKNTGPGIGQRAGGTATLTDCTIRDNTGGGVSNGWVVTLTDCTVSGNSGSGLNNRNTATLTDCTVSGNSGSGLINSGGVTLTNCTLSGNTGSGLVNELQVAKATVANCFITGNSAERGGGILNASGATLALTDCTINDNSATDSGGGLYHNGFNGRTTTTLTNCTISGNSATNNGGGLFSQAVDEASVKLTNCTVSGNSAAKGGGVYHKGYGEAGGAALINCTVSGNSASTSGGGLFNFDTNAPVPLTNTIVAGNQKTPSGASDDIAGSVAGSNNLIGTGGAGGLVDGTDGNMVGVTMDDLGLAALDANGGPTKTMALLPGSPAIDGGTSDGTPSTDQRGLGRIGGTDIGAFEFQRVGSGPSQTITFASLTDRTYGEADFAVKATTTSGFLVTFTVSSNVSLKRVAGVWQVHILGAGSATITAHQAGNSLFDPAPDVARDFNIAKANATVVVTPYTVTYDGKEYKATVTSITGVNGDTGATVGIVDLSNTAHTNAGTYASDSWSFTGSPNYNNIASTTITNIINKANSTVVVASYTVTYDGKAHSATVTSITGVNGETGATVGIVDLSNTIHTNAGTYIGDSWSFTGANYNNARGTVDNSIDKATLTVSANNRTRPYGVANPVLTANFSGFVASETAAVLNGSPSLATTAVAASPPGTYTITASLGTLTAANYKFLFVDGKLTVTPAPLVAAGLKFTATAGAPFSGAVATFTNADPFGSAASYTATINWGDGTTSAGVISGIGAALTVSGSHTFADSMNRTVSVQIGHRLGYTTTATVNSTAIVTSQGGNVPRGKSGSLGFWQNNQGQALIRGFNGGATSTALATWLATTFRNLYGAAAGANNLTGKTNAQVAAFYQAQLRSGTNLEAEVLAAALNVYATTSSLGGNAAAAYGFTVSATGLGAQLVNVRSNGAAFGVPNSSVLNIYQLLQAVNQRAVAGVLYNGNSALRQLAHVVFAGVLE